MRTTRRQIDELISRANYHLEPLGLRIVYEGAYGTHGLNLVMTDNPYGGARAIVRGLTMGELYDYLDAMLKAFSMCENPDRWKWERIEYNE